MTKTLSIEGMTCNHCAGRVEKALQAIDGVESVVVDLEGKSATVKLSKDVADDTLKEAVLDAGYEVTNVK